MDPTWERVGSLWIRSGASQPTGSSGGAVQPADLPTVDVNIGSFNMGIHQAMLHKENHQENFKRVLGMGFDSEDLHLGCFCEVGGHKEGLEALNMDANRLIMDTLTQHFRASSEQSYFCAWQQRPDTTATRQQRIDNCHSQTYLLPQGSPEIMPLHTSSVADPQLVLRNFLIKATPLEDMEGRLIDGQLHIRTPSGKAQLSRKTKERVTKNALMILQRKGAEVISSASQPTAPVLVLTRDVNLTKAEGETIVQMPQGEPSVYTQWQVLTAGGQLSGDIMFVKGTTAHQTKD